MEITTSKLVSSNNIRVLYDNEQYNLTLTGYKQLTDELVCNTVAIAKMQRRNEEIAIILQNTKLN